MYIQILLHRGAFAFACKSASFLFANKVIFYCRSPTRDNMKTSGKRIRELRESRNETQEVLSEKLNISLSMLKKIESGRKGVSVDLLVVFAEYFDTSLDFIVLGRNNTVTNLRAKIKMLIAYMEELEKEI